jgi:hypothetical protein
MLIKGMERREKNSDRDFHHYSLNIGIVANLQNLGWPSIDTQLSQVTQPSPYLFYDLAVAQI